MNSTRPEAEIEYSRGQAPSEGRLPRRARVLGRRTHRLQIALLTGGLHGAALLLGAEFAPLLQVRSSASGRVVKTVATGAHHSYALLPVALLAAGLAYAIWQSRSRLALLATALLGLLALVIALLGDLPDARASGLIGTATTRLATASSSPSVGLYLETLGAFVLLIIATGGLLLTPPQSPRRPARAVRRTSAS